MVIRNFAVCSLCTLVEDSSVYILNAHGKQLSLTSLGNLCAPDFSLTPAQVYVMLVGLLYLTVSIVRHGQCNRLVCMPHDPYPVMLNALGQSLTSCPSHAFCMCSVIPFCSLKNLSMRTGLFHAFFSLNNMRAFLKRSPVAIGSAKSRPKTVIDFNRSRYTLRVCGL